jgi:glyoxylase-like metal-dependent hydrolase (beta-lactamase superfamily II)
MLVADGIAALEISVELFGQSQKIFPVLLWDKTTAMLVDAGFQGQHQKVINALKEYIDSSELGHLVFTHQDIDHIGGALKLIELISGKVITYAHRLERPYIEGMKPLAKITEESICQVLANLPADWPTERKIAIRSALENPPRINIDQVIENGDELPLFGGIVVIGTAGHTPGHISLYHKGSRTLIVGDCLMANNGKLMLPDKGLCSDYTQAMESLRNLLKYNIDRAICYHGGLVEHGINLKIEQLLKSLGTT